MEYEFLVTGEDLKFFSGNVYVEEDVNAERNLPPVILVFVASNAVVSP